MPRYAVVYLATVSSHVEVEAEEKEEAWKLADQEFQAPSLCHHCSSKMDISDWMPSEEEWGTYEV